MRKVRTGTVVRTKMDKTAVVEMVWKQRHRLYRKQVRRVARFQVHDPLKQCLLGDVVRIQEVRPISKTKRWRLLEIMERHQVAEVRPSELESDAEVVVATDQLDAEEEADLDTVGDMEGQDEPDGEDDEDDQAPPATDDVDDAVAEDEEE
jgi:small subunit ribosomal protein S17